MKTFKPTDRHIEILYLIHKHHIASQIAKVLKITTPAVSQNIEKLEKNKYLTENLPRSRIKTYSLTVPAYKLLNSRSHRSGLLNSQKSDSVKYAGLHRISYRFNTLAFPRLFEADYENKLNNWNQGMKDFPLFHMRINTKCIECFWDERTTTDPILAQERAEMRAFLIKRQLESVGFIFDGDPYPNRQPKHSILNDPFVRGLGVRHLSTPNADIDKTPEENTLHPKGNILGDAAKETDAYFRFLLKAEERLSSLEEEREGTRPLLIKLIETTETHTKTMNEVLKKLTPKELETDSRMYG